MAQPRYRLGETPRTGYQHSTNHTRPPAPIAKLLTPAEADVAVQLVSASAWNTIVSAVFLLLLTTVTGS